ncbi:TRAP transporter small permease [Treponema brennaborense]|uniref:Tripartite ATP-independent periplasmic transporter DctQ component n=1 Tax=Treponema brennaborense (strain DSM 12168 / CIP 105900 / DD5/3) TaxID=906968 RepID=F4LKM3_TREBD|nr:TRAP transporter small permease [Treponema brennaborense]AEE17579.1 Tripartite ATP-independent periplasmic transporter DctQ component [Treponema brennaborense DSM 12168]
MIKKLESFERALSVALFLVILAILLWQIFTRKILGTPAPWCDELSRLLFVYLGVISCHLAQRDNIHVRIDALLSAVTHKFRLAVEFAINAVMAGVFIWIAILGIGIVRRTGPKDMLVTLHLSVGILNAALIVLGVLMAIELVAQIINIIRKKEVVRI